MRLNMAERLTSLALLGLLLGATAACTPATRAFGTAFKNAADDIARAAGVTAARLEARAAPIIAAGTVTEEALAAALPATRGDAIQLDQLADRLVAAVRLRGQSVARGTVRDIVQGTVCDAATKLMDGKAVDFQELMQQNTATSVLLPSAAAELVGAWGLVKDTYERLERGVHPQVAINAARATVACARAGR